MNAYVWQYVGQCSGSYHSGGGVVVFAVSEARARELANAKEGCRIRDDERPDAVRGPLHDGCAEEAFIFPNAGCC